MTPAERCLARALIWIDRQLADDGCHACGLAIPATDRGYEVNGDTYCAACGPYAVQRDIARRLRDRAIDLELAEMDDGGTP